MDNSALPMRRFFVNLNAAADTLPSILSVPQPEGIYRGRLIHAEVDHYSAPRPRRPHPYRHMHYHVVLVTGGAGFFDIDGRLYPAGPGAVFFTSPRQSHQFLNAGRDTTRYAELTFEFLRAEGGHLDIDFAAMLSAWTNRRCDPVVSLPLSSARARILAGGISALVKRGLAAPRPDDLELGGLLAEILAVIYRTVFQQGVPQDRIDRARDSIRARYREKLQLASLAKEAGLSPAHFSRRFKERFDRAPIDYQLDLRLRSACELLRASEDSLSAIAAAVGFEDVYYFSRLFRKRLGEAPGRFRLRSKAAM